MKTENIRSYNTGFVLTEQELRRIHALIIDQFQKHLGSAADIEGVYEIKYRNGSISEPNSLDAIFIQENIGSLAITRLKIIVTDKNNPSLYNVTVQFTNLDFEEGSKLKPISYTVIGDDRDWVFIVTSLLDERINRIKRFSINWNRYFDMLLFMPLPFSLMVISFWESANQKSQQLNKLRLIEENYKNGIFKDPIEALIEIEKFKTERDDLPMLMMTFSASLAMPISLFIIYFSWRYFFPAYNLCWGEYIVFKKRRERIGKFIIGSVIFALIISVLANYISALLGIGK
jgi:hypothetical protein